METPSVGPASAGHGRLKPAPRRAVLLGVGNILLSDEGFGVRLVERFASAHGLPEWLNVLDGGTCAMEMLEDLENLDLLVIADCVRVGRPPGSLVVLRDEDIPAFFRTKLSPHQVGLSDVLATLQFTDRAPRRVAVLGMQPASMETGMELSPTVAAVMGDAEAALAALLREYGVPLDALAEVC